MTETFSTGIEGLDRLTGGGLFRGSAYIVQGPPGAGKTILANQLCYAHARAGGRALYMTLLAESNVRMLGYVRQMRFFDERAVPGALQYVSGYGVLEQEGLKGLLVLVQRELERHRAGVMVLDGIFVAQNVAPDKEFRAFVHALQGVAALSDAVLVMLTHQNRESSSPEHTMVDGWIELDDENRGFRSFRTIRVRKHRGASIIPGKHHFRITSDGITVFPRIECGVSVHPRDDVHEARASIGHDGLDRLLGGGLPGASATLLLGPTGSGKTTLGLQFLARASVGEPALMLGFYETPARLRLKARSIGLDLDRLIEEGALELLWFPPAENVADEVLQEVVRRVAASRARRVFVDGLVAIRDGLIESWRMPYVINALSLQLHELGATALYTSEIPELGLDAPVMPSDELSAMVDNVVLLNAGRRGDALRRYLSVVKLRDSDFDPRTHEFHVDDGGIRLGADPRIATSNKAG